jgi:hypothetical protein
VAALDEEAVELPVETRYVETKRGESKTASKVPENEAARTAKVATMTRVRAAVAHVLQLETLARSRLVCIFLRK